MTTTTLTAFLATEPAATTGDDLLLQLALANGSPTNAQAMNDAYAMRKRYRCTRLWEGEANGVTHLYWKATKGASSNAVSAALRAVCGLADSLSQFRAKGTWALLDATKLLAAHQAQLAGADLAKAEAEAPLAKPRKRNVKAVPAPEATGPESDDDLEAHLRAVWRAWVASK